MADEAARVPVIIGVGQVDDRPQDPRNGQDSLDLMEAALRAADADAGGGWLSRLGSLAVVNQISFGSLGELPEPLAKRTGAAPKIAYQTPRASGDSPVLLLNEAANRIAAGEIEVAAVVGGEALRTAAGRAALAAGGDPSSQNAARSAGAHNAHTYHGRYGLLAPVDVYPLYENAGRAAYGQTLAQAQAESGQIWSLFSTVAMENPGAWIKKLTTAQEIIEPSPSNRPIAFPYNKLMVANSSVNQGAAFVVASLAKARAAGVDEDRMIYVGRGAAAHEPEDFLQRDRYDRTPAMDVSLRRALQLNGITADDLDFVELYSCFPCVPKMARRVIGWSADRPASVFGGLTFGGGPIGNYMSHAIVSMVLRLREGGNRGLLFANGGLATHNHTIVLSRESPPAGFLPRDFDFQHEADAARGSIPPLVKDYAGPGTIETYTVLYERSAAPKFGVIVARNPAGARFLAKVLPQDAAGIAFLIDGQVEPVGTAGTAEMGADGDVLWRR
jgi:acetyl-CoA C-acetyltransferase